ncbi:MAG: fatty acid--CoA ligase family protein, partial [Cyanobacteria bacterium P01_C01_bin.38]
SLSSVRRILSGGAALNQALASATLEQLGLVLFNLYGTSEAGFCILATPELLSKKPASIGQPVWGVSTLIANNAREKDSSGKIGQLLIRSAWSTRKQSWVETGDLAYQDAEGDLFLCGRVDDMVVSGGENVYPIELENILIQHPDIESVAVVGIPDEVFGQRLKAVVVLKPDAMLTLSELQGWLKPRVARYQMPAIIEWSDALPYTTLGKIDKQALR